MAAPAHIARENGKKGGRPRGTVSKTTLDRMKVAEELRQRTLKVAGVLFDSQLHLAKGLSYLYRIDKEWVKTGEGKNGEKGFWRNKKPVIVENPEEIRRYLEDEFCNGDAEDVHDPSAAYYFITTVPASNQAIDSMLDRTLGRAKSEIDVNIKVPKPIYGGGTVKQLPQGLPPKKIKAVVIHEHVDKK